MGIQLNKVGVEIDGKVYEMRKMNFGFERRILELESEIINNNKKLLKKYDATPENLHEKISAEDKLELAKITNKSQEAVATLFVNPEEAVILDQFDEQSLQELIEALR